MRSVWTPYNTERIRRERWEVFTGEFLRFVPLLALFLLFASLPAWIVPKAVGQFQHDMEMSE